MLFIKYGNSYHVDDINFLAKRVSNKFGVPCQPEYHDIDTWGIIIRDQSVPLLKFIAIERYLIQFFSDLATTP